MEDHTGRQNAAVFAAEGSVRHHLGRVAVAAAAALLAAWMIALALGVLGGFDSLPGLPNSPSKEPSEAGSTTPPHRQPVAPIRAQQVVTEAPTVSPRTSSSGSPDTQSRGSSPKTTAPQPTVQAPTSTVATPTTHGQGAINANTTTGKPTGSPGNGAGGSGAPGQLR